MLQVDELDFESPGTCTGKGLGQEKDERSIYFSGVPSQLPGLAQCDLSGYPSLALGVHGFFSIMRKLSALLQRLYHLSPRVSFCL